MRQGHPCPSATATGNPWTRPEANVSRSPNGEGSVHWTPQHLFANDSWHGMSPRQQHRTSTNDTKINTATVAPIGAHTTHLLRRSPIYTPPAIPNELKPRRDPSDRRGGQRGTRQMSVAHSIRRRQGSTSLLQQKPLPSCATRHIHAPKTTHVPVNALANGILYASSPMELRKRLPSSAGLKSLAILSHPTCAQPR